MANRKQANIPKFGEWKDGGGSTPYTVVFDNARIKKTNPNVNPNDPSQFQEIVGARPAAPKPNAAPPQPMKDSGAERREERRYPPSTQPQVRGRPSEDVMVPKFGDWNDASTGTGHDYTGQFQRVGEQRNRERDPGAAPPTRYDQAYNSPYATGTERLEVVL
ncbi:Cleavage site for pathogenic type III effector avirulence factor Avr [Carex littledalei]|uniref:Cleavage site for pathogenic type III effector avirulence factor Avr n=1 Tax=Carex littledalei TaxID=544730 RepID=A0A833VV00_9POAL|nr:Cleavage site for pathogenic type III effector avirulence factor Avr [Carex littledalei]